MFEVGDQNVSEAFEGRGRAERAIKEYEIHIMINESGWTVEDAKARIERLKAQPGVAGK